MHMVNMNVIREPVLIGYSSVTCRVKLLASDDFSKLSGT